jgi:hypothetical protein
LGIAYLLIIILVYVYIYISFQMSRLTYTGDGFSCHLECSRCEHLNSNGQRCRRTVCFGIPVCWQHTRAQYGVRTGTSTIPGAGKGLFAMKAFAIDDWICPYVGESITDACSDLRYGQGTAPYSTAANDQGTQHLDSACRRGTAAMANGLFYANGRSRPLAQHNARIYFNEDNGDRPWLGAIRPIAVGHEIFVYYGTDYLLQHNHQTKRRRGGIHKPC